ncbi:hypothetical protein [Siphoviridae environmental samples]|nr:hypothetical protein [Siphoviridae environmental samples]
MSLDVWLTMGDETVFEWNITHNLRPMAELADFAEAAWRPDCNGITKAGQLSFWLERGIINLVKRKAEMEKLNPENGWGDYEGLFDFTVAYAVACNEYPDAEVRVSR